MAFWHELNNPELVAAELTRFCLEKGVPIRETSAGGISPANLRVMPDVIAYYFEVLDELVKRPEDANPIAPLMGV